MSRKKRFLLLLRTAGTTQTFTYAASGGISLAGGAAYSKTQDYVGSGGLTLAGAASLAKGKSVTPAGGMTAAGAAATSKGKTYSASGGLALAGAATTSLHLAVHAYTGTGGLAFGGAAQAEYFAGPHGVPGGGLSWLLARRYERPPEKPQPVRRYAYEPSGGLLLGGAAATEFIPVPNFARELMARLTLPHFGGAARVEHFDALVFARERDDEELFLEDIL